MILSLPEFSPSFATEGDSVLSHWKAFLETIFHLVVFVINPVATEFHNTSASD
jgi:hypothetical protein